MLCSFRRSCTLGSLLIVRLCWPVPQWYDYQQDSAFSSVTLRELIAVLDAVCVPGGAVHARVLQQLREWDGRHGLNTARLFERRHALLGAGGKEGELGAGATSEDAACCRRSTTGVLEHELALPIEHPLLTQQPVRVLPSLSRGSHLCCGDASSSSWTLAASEAFARNGECSREPPLRPHAC